MKSNSRDSELGGGVLLHRKNLFDQFHSRECAFQLTVGLVFE
jgi:hypothetical protein